MYGVRCGIWGEVRGVGGSVEKGVGKCVGV